MRERVASADAEEIAKFARGADAWWQPRGPMAPLHRLNPACLAFARAAACAAFGLDAKAAQPLAARTVLDVGCGGGLLAEPLARLGGAVTGIDLVARSLDVARRHAAEQGLAITYRLATAEELAADGERFDLVVASEVIEHVKDPAGFVTTLATLTATDGLLVLSTVNRTARAYVEAIVAAEYVLNWLPRGTHRWRRFVRPAELAAWLRRSGMTVFRLEGMGLDATGEGFTLRRDVAVNYLIAARRLPTG